MVAVENSENALLVENDMHDTSNKKILVARPGESSSRRNYINSVSFFFPRRLYRMEGKNGSVSLAEKRDSIVDWNSYG